MQSPRTAARSLGNGRYEILRTLGSGTFATVYVARDSRLDRDVAIKVLKELWTGSSARDRFEQEIAVQERLHHPNIIPLLDRAATDDTMYFVMPVAQDGSLEQVLKRDGALSLDAARRLLGEMTEALGYAHAEGVTHRDVKPSNILVSAGHAWLSDFGILRLLESTDDPRLTPSGMTVGSPAYMSPEQLLGDRNVGPRSDIYSLGLVLYEALAGLPPFMGRDAQSTASLRLSASPLPLRAHRPDIDEAMEEAIMRALQREAASRWATAREMWLQCQHQ